MELAFRGTLPGGIRWQIRSRNRVFTVARRKHPRLGTDILRRYVYEFFDYIFAADGEGTQFYPGSTSAATAIITMQADGAASSQDISRPFYYGTGGNQGKYSIWMADENCANSGGCAVGP